MNEKHVFAAVDLPFHVWVKEGGRWVLREAHVQSHAAMSGAAAANDKAAQRAA
jgi:hypothetical protein